MNIIKELERCAKCGQCRSVCPVFLALKDETLVARGRLAIIQAKHQASRDTYNLYTKILDTCLMCRRCEENCPSLVNTSEVFRAERQKLVREKGLPPLLRVAFRWVLPNRWVYDSVMRLASWVMRLRFQTHNTQRMTHNAQRPLRHLPLYFTNLFQLIPRLAPKSALGSIEHRAKSKEKSTLYALRSTPVTIFIGCAANYIYPEIISDLTSILDRLKIPYVIPPRQVCCGMPALLSGDIKTAEKLSRINQELFKTNTIITVCPTCNRMLTEEYNLKSIKVMDAIEFLSLNSSVLSFPRSSVPTAYHQPCHSAGTKTPEIIKAFLKANTDFRELEEDVCCGGGGLFSFKYPELSGLIGQARMQSIGRIAENIPIDIGTLTVVTNCPGCMMQLEYLLSSNSKTGLHLHPVRSEHNQKSNLLSKSNYSLLDASNGASNIRDIKIRHIVNLYVKKD